MSITDELKNIVSGIPAKINEKKGVYEFEVQLAERKAFLTKQKLIYSAKFRVDEQAKEVRFTEMLKESGAGVSTGGASDDMSPGFGFKKETYNTFSGTRSGTIEEQSSLFGKKYEYKFDYGAIRKKFESKAKEHGYKFTYKITGFSL